MVGLTLLIVLRLTLLAGMDPPDMTETFFGIIPPPRDVAVKILADKAGQLQTVYRDRATLHRGMARSQGFNFLLKENVRPYYRNT